MLCSTNLRKSLRSWQKKSLSWFAWSSHVSYLTHSSFRGSQSLVLKQRKHSLKLRHLKTGSKTTEEVVDCLNEVLFLLSLFELCTVKLLPLVSVHRFKKSLHKKLAVASAWSSVAERLCIQHYLSTDTHQYTNKTVLFTAYYSKYFCRNIWWVCLYWWNLVVCTCPGEHQEFWILWNAEWKENKAKKMREVGVRNVASVAVSTFFPTIKGFLKFTVIKVGGEIFVASLLWSSRMLSS